METTKVKEHPILFTTDNVKAILDGKKTQTRRIMNPQLKDNAGWRGLVPLYGFGDYSHGHKYHGHFRLEEVPEVCPYGQVGDRLWVRETFFDNAFFEDDQDNVLYRADGEFEEQIPEDYIGAAWSPSIHMFKWMARIWLEITKVRVERVQDISEDDAKAEGVPGIATHKPYPKQYRDSFEVLWDSINLKRGSWESNPWVWVIEFEKILKPPDGGPPYTQEELDIIEKITETKST